MCSLVMVVGQFCYTPCGPTIAEEVNKRLRCRCSCGCDCEYRLSIIDGTPICDYCHFGWKGEPMYVPK